MTQPLPSSIGQLSAAAATSASDEGAPAPEQRNELRITLLIRAAKLIAGDDEFLVVLRDVSRDGARRLPARLRGFRRQAAGGRF